MMTRNTLHDPAVWEALQALPSLGATDGHKTDRPAVKLFMALGQGFWVFWEYDPTTGVGFGYADLYGDGVFGELGYTSIFELRDEFGAFIERDISVATLTDGYASRGVTVPHYLVERKEV